MFVAEVFEGVSVGVIPTTGFEFGKVDVCGVIEGILGGVYETEEGDEYFFVFKLFRNDCNGFIFL